MIPCLPLAIFDFLLPPRFMLCSAAEDCFFVVTEIPASLKVLIRDHHKKTEVLVQLKTV